MSRITLRLVCSGLCLVWWLAFIAEVYPVHAGRADGTVPLLHKVQATGDKMAKRPVHEEISARSFRAIEAAIVELERRILKVDGYQIVVLQQGTSVIVAFLNPEHTFRGDGPPPVGCIGPRSCLIVELRADNLQVIRSDFLM